MVKLIVADNCIKSYPVQLFLHYYYFIHTGVLDDTYALCMAGKQKLVTLLHLIAAYKDETEYTVLAHAIGVHYSFYSSSTLLFLNLILV